MWFYMGQFKNRDAVLDYLEKLGYNRSNVSPYVGSGNGDGGEHWRIECNGSEGCVINNNTDGNQRDAGPISRFTLHVNLSKLREFIFRSSLI